MQRILAAILCSAFIVLICGCGGGSDDTVASSSDTAATAPTTPTTPTAPSKPKSSGNQDSEGAMSSEEQMRMMMEQSSLGSGDEDEMSAEEQMRMMMEQEARDSAENGGEGSEEAMRQQQEQMAEEMKMQAEQEEAQRKEMEAEQQRMQEGGEYGEGGEFGREKVVIPKTFKGKSDLAFEQGHDKEAFQYLYAHYLTSPEGAADHELHLFSGLKAPRTVMRWGFAINYTTPKGLTVTPPLIGEKPNITPEDIRNRRGGGDGGGDYEQFQGGGDGSGFRVPKTAIGKMDYFTGDIGRQILEEIDSRRTEKSALGSAISKMAYELPEMKKSSGFGGEMDNMEGMDEYGGGGARKKIFLSEADQLLPGVILVGGGTSKEMLPMAKSRDVDLLVMIDVRVARNARSGLISNSTSLNVYNANTGEKLFKSSTLMNTAHWQGLQKDKDSIAEMVEKMFERVTVEKGYQASPMPELTADQAFKRVKSLLEEKYENPLPVLAEVNHYYRSDKKLLAENAFKAATARLIGEENGAMFLEDSPEQKARAIAKWLPSNWEEGLEGFGADENLVSAAAPNASTDVKSASADEALNATKKQGLDVFNNEIKPVFVRTCYKCHSSKAAKVKGEFKVDTFDELVKGGETGPAVVPGKPDESLLMETLNYEGEIKMPPKQKLSNDEIAAFRKWIELGAPVP